MANLGVLGSCTKVKESLFKDKIRLFLGLTAVYETREAVYDWTFDFQKGKMFCFGKSEITCWVFSSE